LTRLEVDGPELPEHQHDRQAHADVTDAVGDERLVGGAGVGRVPVPEADEQVGRQADALPADIDQQVGVGQDQQEHGGDEEVEVGEEPPLVGVVLHVAQRVDVDERPDEGHQQHEGDRELVEQHPGLELELPGRHPVEQVHRLGPLFRAQARAT
jgi:hypothetical protein